MNKQDLVKQARTWIGTPYHHQGRVKKVGADCIGLLVGVLKDLNVLSNVKDKDGNFIPLYRFDDSVYSFNPNGHKLQKIIRQFFRPKDVKDIEPGDIVLMCWAKFPQHVAYVSDYNDKLGLIHIHRHAGKCVEHNLDETWKSRIVEAYEVVFYG